MHMSKSIGSLDTHTVLLSKDNAGTSGRKKEKSETLKYSLAIYILNLFF